MSEERYKKALAAVSEEVNKIIAYDETPPEVQCVRVEPNKVGFLGAAAVTRQQLTPDATNLPTCITLANAIKHMLIQFGFAE